MKQILGIDTGSVTFTPGAAGAGTVVIAGMTGFAPSRLLAITNVTRKALLYVAEGGSGLAGAWSSVTAAGGTLTLDISTSGYSAGDVLRCLYEPNGESYDYSPSRRASNLPHNILPDFSDTSWVKHAQVTTLAKEGGAGPMSGSAAWHMVNAAAVDNEGVRNYYYLSGRSDGKSFTWAIWARGSGTMKLELIGRDVGVTIAETVTEQFALSSTWQRVYITLTIKAFDVNRLEIRIRHTTVGQAVDAELWNPCLVSGRYPVQYADNQLYYANAGVVEDNSLVSLLAIGDSLTAGANGYEYRTELSRMLKSAYIYSCATGGYTSSQILTAVSALTAANKRYGIWVIWAGRNNFNDPTTVLSDIESIIAQCPHARYLVLSVTNRTSETLGGTEHTTILALNAQLKSRYGRQFVDVRTRWCQGSLTDTPWPSLMSDTTHPNAVGHIADNWPVDGFTSNSPLATSPNSTLSSVAAAVASTELLPARRRKGFSVVNDSATANLYLALAASASATAYTCKLPPGATYFYDMPHDYTGPVYGYWDAASGNARVTEFP
jgi:hypothetical protein